MTESLHRYSLQSEIAFTLTQWLCSMHASEKTTPLPAVSFSWKEKKVSNAIGVVTYLPCVAVYPHVIFFFGFCSIFCSVLSIRCRVWWSLSRRRNFMLWTRDARRTWEEWMSWPDSTQWLGAWILNCCLYCASLWMSFCTNLCDGLCSLFRVGVGLASKVAQAFTMAVIKFTCLNGVVIYPRSPWET